jgi:hypothetical protein
MKLLPMPICYRFFPIRSFSSFKVSCLKLKSLTHFDLILVQGDGQGSSFNLLHVNIQFFPASFIEEAVFFKHMF